MDEIKYEKYKSIITHTSKKGKPLCEFTTWRGDIVKSIIEATTINGFEVGDKMSIDIIIADKEN